MKIRIYRTRWPICDNVVISLWEDCVQVGIVELRIFHKGDYEGECYIWNLHVNPERRGKGYGRTLLKAAINIAKNSECKIATLDWFIEESPKWVFDWYIRNGFEGREFGQDRTFMVKTLKEEIEEKEVDLEEEIKNLIEKEKAFITDNREVKYYNGDSFNHIYELEFIAKHFYELGLKKAQKENKL